MVHGSFFLLFFLLSDFAQSLGSLFRVAYAFQLWRGPFVSDTSPKFIDREGLGGRCTWTRRDQTVDRVEVKLLQKKSQC